MIPRSATTDEIFGNALRGRVTACRKRLRVSRSVHRPQAPEAELTAPDANTLAQFPADSSRVRQLVSLDLSPAFGDKQARSLVESVGDQEVGIT